MPARSGVLHNVGGLSRAELTSILAKAKSQEFADGVVARMDLAAAKKNIKDMGKAAKDAALDFRNKYKNTIASVIVVAPLGAAIGAFVGDWLHDKVVEKLGKDNFATPYVVPLAGAVITVIGYEWRSKDLDVRAFVTGLGIGMTAQGVKRSYYDFWSKP